MSQDPSQHQPPHAPGGLRFDRVTWGLVAVLLVLVAGAFWGVRNCSFIDLDDSVYVWGNPQVLGGLTAKNIAWAWRADNRAGYWIPLTWLSLELDSTLNSTLIEHHAAAPAGTRPRLPDAPGPLPDAVVFHVHNLLLHAIASVLLFVFLYRATKLRQAAFVAALLWAIHPLRVESVAWVTERKDVLAAVLGFLAMYLYVGWVERGKWWRYAVVGVVFAMSLMAKPLFVTLPGLLVLIDAWPLGRVGSVRDLLWRLGEKWLFFMLAIGASVLVVITQRQANAVRTLEQIGLGTRLGHAVVEYVMYIVRQVRVWDLAIEYPYEAESAAVIGACAVVLAAATGLCVWQWRRRPWLLVGWLWYLGAMVPMIGLVQAGEQGSADRFSYLPAVGLFMMVGFTLGEWWMKWPGRRVVVGGGVAVAAGLLIAMTVRQVGYWQNTITLVSRSLAVTGSNFQLHGTLAAGYLREGENDLAAEQFGQAVALKPDFAPARRSLGLCYLETGRIPEAVQMLGKAAQLDPRYGKGRYLLAMALERGGHLPEAIHEYQAAEHFALLQPDPATAAGARKRLEALQSGGQRGPGSGGTGQPMR